ncbi:hypothetical protein G5714_002569 [Onychostoma macrolepis]|uniref:Uncharacterized protein n=1 Tax=Onychostoma macrolepis TaxID=369639 RepID=A0A7J6D748_9TELE|nr:hypothetical protein G5714_002569 [Onychostoma macrolepis]
MSSATNDKDSWQVESIEESQQHPSQAEEAIQDKSNVSVCQSSRLATDFAPPPPFSSKKHVKNIDPAAAAPKRAGGPAGSARAGNSTVQSNDSVLSELSFIQSLLFDMNSRIQALEFAQHPSPLQISFSPACLPPTLQRTMGSPLALHSFHQRKPCSGTISWLRLELLMRNCLHDSVKCNHKS